MGASPFPASHHIGHWRGSGGGCASATGTAAVGGGCSAASSGGFAAGAAAAGCSAAAGASPAQVERVESAACAGIPRKQQNAVNKFWVLESEIGMECRQFWT